MASLSAFHSLSRSLTSLSLFCVCGAQKKMEREEEEIKVSLGSPLIQISEEEDGFTISSSREGRITRKEVFEEVRKQLWLAGPLITVSLLQYSLQMISVMFVGHLGELALSGASMATSFATVTGFSLLVSWLLFISFSLVSP